MAGILAGLVALGVVVAALALSNGGQKSSGGAGGAAIEEAVGCMVKKLEELTNDPSFTEPFLLSPDVAVRRSKSQRSDLGETGRIDIYRARGDVAVSIFLMRSASDANEAAQSLSSEQETFDYVLARKIHAYRNAVIYPDLSARDELVSGIEQCL